MRAVQVMAPGDARVVDIPKPEAADNEVLIEVRACVTCPHWDISLFRGVDIFERPDYPKYPVPPGYPGHEMSGQIVAAGRAVKQFKVGDRVGTLVTGGEENPGFYAEYVARPESTVAVLPDNVSYEAGASLEMARFVAAHVRVMDVKGLRTGVTGLGPAGLLALQMLKALGAREVVGMDILPQRLGLAADLGASETMDTSNEDNLKKLEAQPLEASVDCTGAAAGLQLALDHTRGPVSIFGVVHGTAKFTTSHWCNGTYIPRRPASDREDTEFIMDLWKKGQLDTEKFLGARLPFERYAEGIKMLMDRKVIRVCFQP